MPIAVNRPMADQKYYTGRDLCEMLRISRTTLHRMDKRGEIPGRITLGSRTVRYWKPAVDDWLGRLNQDR